MKNLSKPLFATDHLNDFLENIAKARLIFIGGRSGSMKFTLLHNLLQRHLESVRNVPVFITGTGKDYLINKWKDLGLVMQNNVAYSKDDRRPVFFLDEINGWDMEKTCNQIRNLHHLYKVSFAVIDSLENIKNDDCYDFQDKIEENVEKLRLLAFELGITILILSELDPKIEKRQGHKKRPCISDLYNSRMSSMPDYIILLYRPEYYRIDKWEDETSTANQLELNFEKTPAGTGFSHKLLFHFNERKDVVFPEIHHED